MKIIKINYAAENKLIKILKGCETKKGKIISYQSLENKNEMEFKLMNKSKISSINIPPKNLTKKEKTTGIEIINSMRLKREIQNVKNESIKSRIEKGREKLNFAKVELKKYFVGIDDIIDSIITNIENWYLIPESVTRPVIINLWGMTGVGKTDLVRKLVKLLDMSDVFLEIQVSNTDSSGRFQESTISEAISYNSNIERKEPGIILVDEIQNFRDVDKRGDGLPSTKYQDLWTLLSDGKLPSFTKRSDIIDTLISFINNDRLYGTENHNQINQYNAAKRIKNIFNLDIEAEELIRLESKALIELVKNNFDSAFENEDYSKLLVFISGNLDDAYHMAEMVGTSEIDADIFYKESKKIDFIKIKHCLTELFKPEHISRMGNVHLIYPSFSKKTYQEIIKRKIDEVLFLTKSRIKVNITCDESVYDFIYRNGVFPSQGIRPVLTTISSYLESSIPKIVMFAIDNDDKNVSCKYEDYELKCSDGKTEIGIPWIGSIDRIKKNRNNDAAVLHSVHESGHAIMYSILFGIVPSQVMSCSNVPTSSFGGVTIFGEQVILSKKYILDKIAVLYGGIAAEEIVFGSSKISSGSTKDISDATSLVADSIKEWGLFGSSSLVRNPANGGQEGTNTDDSVELNAKIEQVCSDQRSRAVSTLSNFKSIIKEFSDIMIKTGKIEPEEMESIMNNNGVKVRKSNDSEDYLIEDYSNEYEKFSSSLK